MKHYLQRKYHGLIGAIVLSNGLSVCLLAARFSVAGNYRYWYMVWNLFLAWVPVFFAILATSQRDTPGHTNWRTILYGVLWLGFVPNSFYVLSDLIHLHASGEIGVLYDAVLLSSFIFNGFLAGYISVFLMHQYYRRVVGRQIVMALVGGVFFLCGFAVYLGRTLRWNSWDILVNPAGILFDVSDSIVNPLAHPQIVLTTLTFFLIILVVYLVIYEVIAVSHETGLPKQPKRPTSD